MPMEPTRTVPVPERHAIGQALLIGFSFGLRADAAPGKCNCRIALSIKDFLLKAPVATRPSGIVQWEIFDALEELDDQRFQAAMHISPDRVAGPPCFVAADILSPVGLMDELLTPRTPAGDIMLRHLSENCAVLGITDSEIRRDPDATVKGLNSLLPDRHLFKRFQPLLDLHDLVRDSKRPIGIEKRAIPRAEVYPFGLRRFQSIRVNRLILESLLSERVLRRGGYMNTRGVADAALSALPGAADVESVLVFCHPHHFAWCERMTREAVATRGGRASVICGDASSWEPAWLWDVDSAQVWCRSEKNLVVYKAM